MQYTRSARPVFCKNKTQKARTKHKKMKESSMNVRFTLSLRSLATAGIIALALPLAAQATNITFTNAVLKAYVVAHYDKDGDSEISEAEALLVTAINVYGGYDTTKAQSGTKTKIGSFADIANFPNLDTLDCALNSLTYLACYDNQLTSLDVSKNTKLTYLDCHNNQFTSLDVSKNTELTVLYCAYDQLTSLDVSANTSLMSLFCYHNRLTSLDGSKNTKLTQFYCHNNQLTSLDVSKNTKLTQFYCHNNQLTSLDISANTSLTTLFCYH